jgi:hypothetical protein
MEYISPRSVSRLEQELEELEKQAGLTKEEDEEEIEEPAKPKAVEKEDEDEGNFKKRYGDLRRHSSKQAEDLKKAQAKIAELENQKSGLDLPSPEEFEDWAKANPKAAAIIRAIANEQVSRVAPKSEDLNTVKDDLVRMKEEAKIRKVHPDFDEIVNDDKFHDWVETQPESIQNLVYDGSGTEVIWALNQYKKETAKVENPGKQAAKAVVTKGTSAEPADKMKMKFSESQVQKMSLAEYEKNEEAIQNAMKSGAFVYDLSGAAR